MNRKILIIVLCLSLGSCAIGQRKEQISKSGDLKTEIGLNLVEIKKIHGEPNAKNTESFDSQVFSVVEYEDQNKNPISFYTLDEKENVIGKSTWIRTEQKSADLEWLLEVRYANHSFKKYVPCKTTGPQNFLIDVKNGVLIAHQENRVIFISESTPDLAQLRAQQFEKKCPQLQGK